MGWSGLCRSVIAVFFLGISLWSADAVFLRQEAAVYEENGPIEALQAIVLAASCLGFLSSVVRKGQGGKAILLFCSLLCYSFVLRELDVERFDVPAVIKLVGSGAGRNATLAVAFSALLIYVASRFSRYRKALLLFLREKPGILLMAGGLFLFAGDIFEKSHGIIHYGFFEEIFELYGYGFILWSALATLSRSDSGSKPNRNDAALQDAHE